MQALAQAMWIGRRLGDRLAGLLPARALRFAALREELPAASTRHVDVRSRAAASTGKAAAGPVTARSHGKPRIG